MKSNPTLRRKYLRTVFGIFSLSGILFVFQACYGSPQDFGLDILIRGKVVSASTHEGIPDIKVSIPANSQYVTTAADGSFSLYTERLTQYKISFSDTDGAKNGTYQVRDTVVTLPETSEMLDLQIELN